MYARFSKSIDCNYMLWFLTMGLPNPFSKQALVFTCPLYKCLENTVRKGVYFNNDHDFAPCSVTDGQVPVLSEPQIKSRDNLTVGSHVYVNEVLMNLGREVVSVRGDGHCIFHAFRVTLSHEGIAQVFYEIFERLFQEISDNIDYYGDVATESQSIIQEIERYIRDKEYNTDTSDMVLMLCATFFGVFAIVNRHESTVLVVRSGGRGLGNLFTAVANHVAPSRSPLPPDRTTKLLYCKVQKHLPLNLQI